MGSNAAKIVFLSFCRSNSIKTKIFQENIKVRQNSKKIIQFYKSITFNTDEHLETDSNVIEQLLNYRSKN